MLSGTNVNSSIVHQYFKFKSAYETFIFIDGGPLQIQDLINNFEEYQHTVPGGTFIEEEKHSNLPGDFRNVMEEDSWEKDWYHEEVEYSNTENENNELTMTDQDWLLVSNEELSPFENDMNESIYDAMDIANDNS